MPFDEKGSLRRKKETVEEAGYIARTLFQSAGGDTLSKTDRFLSLKVAVASSS